MDLREGQSSSMAVVQDCVRIRGLSEGKAFDALIKTGEDRIDDTSCSQILLGSRFEGGLMCWYNGSAKSGPRCFDHLQFLPCQTDGVCVKKTYQAF